MNEEELQRLVKDLRTALADTHLMAADRANADANQIDALRDQVAQMRCLLQDVFQNPSYLTDSYYVAERHAIMERFENIMQE